MDDAELERRAGAHAAYAAGVLRGLDEDPEGQLEAWERVVALDPGREDLRIEVARRRLARRETDAALRLLRLGADRREASAERLALLGLAHVQKGDVPAAEAAYRRAVEAAPGDPDLRITLARLLVEAGRPADAVPVLQALVAMEGVPFRAALDVIDLLGAAGKAEDQADECRALAGRLLDRLDGQSVDDARLAGRLAEHLAAAGRNDRAEAWFRKARDIAPANPFSAARLAEMYLRSGRLDDAVAELESLHRQDPTNPVPLYYLGVIALDRGEPARARELLERAVLLNPEFEPAGLDLIAACLALDDAPGAVEAARRARERLKPGFRLEYLSALAFARARDWPAARARFEAAEALGKDAEPSPLDHRFYFQVGAFMEQAGWSAEAVPYLERSLALKPDFDEALNHLGYMWAEQGVNLERALDMIRRAVEAEPDNAAYLDSLGWVLHKMMRPGEALVPLQRAVELLREDPDATVLDHLGDVLARLGRTDEARKAWEQALAIEPTDALREKLAGTAPGAAPAP